MAKPAAPHHLLVYSLIFVTVIWACTANHILNDTDDDGSGLAANGDDEDG